MKRSEAKKGRSGLGVLDAAAVAHLKKNHKVHRMLTRIRQGGMASVGTTMRIRYLLRRMIVLCRLVVRASKGNYRDTAFSQCSWRFSCT